MSTTSCIKIPPLTLKSYFRRVAECIPPFECHPGRTEGIRGHHVQLNNPSNIIQQFFYSGQKPYRPVKTDTWRLSDDCHRAGRIGGDPLRDGPELPPFHQRFTPVAEDHHVATLFSRKVDDLVCWM